VVLVDTSVWVRFLAGRDPFARDLRTLIESEDVVAHELVYGELLIGDRRGRARLLADYDALIRLPRIAHDEVVTFVRARRLTGRIGWIDAHLLASCIVAGVRLWTADASLHGIATELRAAYAA